MDWRAITVREPWASPIVDGYKPVENRGGHFTTKWRGGILIHTSQLWSERGGDDARIRHAYSTHRLTISGPRGRAPEWTFGAFIGCVMCIDAHHAEPGCCESEWAEYEYRRADGSIERNVVHLVLNQPRRFRDPLDARGRLGLWKPSADDLGELPL